MLQRTRIFLFLPLLMLLAIGGAFAHPTQASAASKAATSIKTQVQIFWQRGHVQPNSGGGAGNLLYHGGPVMGDTAKAYAIFWEPKGTFVGEGYNELLKRYFNDVGDSPLYENNEQYTDTSGKAPEDASLANTWVDRSPYPTTPVIFDADIQNEVTHAMLVKGWTPSINHIFFVFLSLNEHLCIDQTFQACDSPGGFCAYHAAFGLEASPTIYAAMPYDGNSLAGCYGLSGSPNQNAAADAEISTTSHEQIEAATDPLGNAWFDKNGGSGEIGDKCAYVYGPLKKDGSNVSWNGHHYVVQSEWDNAVSGCVLKGP